MRAHTRYEQHDDRPTEDQVVLLSGVSWEDYERLLAMRGNHYVPIEESEVLPALDLQLLTSFIDRPTTFDAIREYRQALRDR
jgi:hypothetical protein